jgi:hypothetical protein
MLVLLFLLTRRRFEHEHFLNGEITFIYIRLDTSKVVSIGTTGSTSITHNVINNYNIN